MGLGERLHKTLPHAHPYSCYFDRISEIQKDGKGQGRVQTNYEVCPSVSFYFLQFLDPRHRREPQAEDSRTRVLGVGRTVRTAHCRCRWTQRLGESMECRISSVCISWFILLSRTKLWKNRTKIAYELFCWEEKKWGRGKWTKVGMTFFEDRELRWGFNVGWLQKLAVHTGVADFRQLLHWSSSPDT